MHRVNAGPLQQQAGRAEQHGGRPGDSLSLADAAPVLLTSEASLAQLNEWVADRAAAEGEPVLPALAMARFRPNVVIDGQRPFAEDGWQGVRIGAVRFRLAELCDRCVMTTIDPDRLTTGKEPIRTLARHRRWDRLTWFGVRLIPQSTGLLRIGDQVELA
ncbi:MAG: MOSC domain-containing protein [Jatrophihabitantaceae bacterium]